jgi:hypothetical protein
MAKLFSSAAGPSIGRRAALIFTALVAVLCSTVNASYVSVPFEEVAQTADLVFVGTVAGLDCTGEGPSGMIFTQVHFADIQVVHTSARSIQARLGDIRLTHAGGKVGGRGVWVSLAPSFRLGRRYLVFALDDGLVYANPVVGGPQGQFEIIQDKVTLQDYLLTPDGRAILGVGPEGIKTSTRPVDSIRGGALFYRPEEAAPDPLVFTQLPIPSGNDSVSAGVPEARPASIETPLTLAAFIDYTMSTAMTAPLSERRLKLGNGGGKFITRVGDQVIEQALAAMPAKRLELSIGRPAGQDIPQGQSIEEWYDSDLFACGYHDPTFTMEQVAATHWDYAWNEYAMATWNFTIDFYRYSPDDGTFGGDNGENEFVGFIDDAQYYAAYGFHWGGASGMTISYIDAGDPCDEIHESDVMFNSAYSWTSDFLTFLGGSVQYYQAAVIHETGHVWGLMSGKLKPETYAYNHPSVMNNAGTDIIEDATEVHVPDVNLMRRVYDGLTSVPQVKDVGVESYYASLGLHKSTTSAASYYPGDSITISNVTVENLSPTAQTDVRLRFYLSTDRTVTTADNLMGYYWSWPTFSKETYSVANYTTTVPYIASGQYFVGAIVTVNGFGTDDAQDNNATYLTDTINVYPMPPSNVQASDGTYTDKIRVTWTAVSDPAVTAYQVWRSATDTGTKSYLGQVTNNYYDDTSPLGGWNYYWVRSVAASGTSLYSSYDSGYVGVTAPTGLTASDGTYTTHVALSWTAVVGASGYQIWRNTQIDTSTATQIGTSTAASYNDTTAVPELMYYYWVKATNGIATSGFSAYNAGWRHLATPTNVQASDGTFSDKVRVTWDIVAYAATYQVRRNTANDFSTAATVAAAVSGTTYDDTSATPMQTYYYWVRAENGFGYSQFSPPDSGYRATPVPQAAEVVGDFGNFGLWMLHNSVWTQLSGINPEAFIFADVDGDGYKELFGDFGIFGLWLWDNDVWTHLTWYNPDAIISADTDGDGRAELIGDFGNIGLWVWNGGDWQQLTGVNPESIAAADIDGDGRQDVAGDFGSLGVWIYVNYVWYFTSPLNADSLTSGDIDGDHRGELIGDFGAAGVWIYDNYTWTQITTLNAEALLAFDQDADGTDEIAGDFGLLGLWLWKGGAWTNLTLNNPVTMIAANLDGHADLELVANYVDVWGAVFGFWIWDSDVWTKINPLNPETIAAGDIDADGVDEIIGDFGPLGLWYWDAGAWIPLTGANAENIGAANIK